MCNLELKRGRQQGESIRQLLLDKRSKGLNKGRRDEMKNKGTDLKKTSELKLT